MQKGNKGSKAPKRPLCVDLTDNLLTTPRQVLGYTLTLMNDEEKYIPIYYLAIPSSFQRTWLVSLICKLQMELKFIVEKFQCNIQMICL